MNKRPLIKQGEPIKALCLDAMHLTYTYHTAGTQLSEHEHPYECVTFVLSGAFDETFDRKVHHCRQLSLLYKPAGMPHSNVYLEEGAQSFIIEFMPETIAGLQEFASFSDVKSHLEEGALSAIAIRAFSQFQMGSEISLLHAEELLLELILKGHKRLRYYSRGTVPRWLAEIKEYIHAAYMERISLSGLAMLSGVHPVHLARCFRAHFGCSVGTYIHRCRLDKAVKKLAQPEVSIAQLAFDLGYSDQSHFSRTFKLETGISPAHFHKMCSAHLS